MLRDIEDYDNQVNKEACFENPEPTRIELCCFCAHKKCIYENCKPSVFVNEVQWGRHDKVKKCKGFIPVHRRKISFFLCSCCSMCAIFCLHTILYDYILASAILGVLTALFYKADKELWKMGRRKKR